MPEKSNQMKGLKLFLNEKIVPTKIWREEGVTPASSWNTPLRRELPW